MSLQLTTIMYCLVKFGVDSFERVVGYDADKRTLTFVSIKDAVYYCTNNEEMSIESCIQSNEKYA